MSRGVNKVIIIGNLGAEPEVRYLPSGSAVTNIRVATSEQWKDPQTNELQKRTEWHRITLFNRLGEIAAEYLHKGSKVYIEGSLRTNKWQDQNGQDRYSIDIIASNLQLLDSRGGQGDFVPGEQSAPARTSRPASSSSFSTPPQSTPMPESVMTDSQLDDQIPF